MPFEDRNPIFSSHSKSYTTMEVVDSRLTRMGYLEKKVNKRGAENQEVEYRWGPRAKVEMRGEDMVEFISHLYADPSPEIKSAIGKAGGLARPAEA